MPPRSTNGPMGQGPSRIGDNGNVIVHPTKDTTRSIDLKQLVDDLQLRGIHLPTLIRFRDILQHRVQDIHEASARRWRSTSTRAVTCAFIQSRSISSGRSSKRCLNSGVRFGFGLEAGSKPELMAVIALADNETPIICNGFKDAEFIEMAMLAQKIGRRIIPVVEKYTELPLILEYAERVGRAADHRHAGQARGARQRALAVIGWLSGRSSA